MQWHKVFTVARKAGVSTLGLLAMALDVGLVPAPWDKFGAAILVVATYYGVYKVRNVPVEEVK